MADGPGRRAAYRDRHCRCSTSLHHCRSSMYRAMIYRSGVDAMIPPHDFSSRTHTIISAPTRARTERPRKKHEDSGRWKHLQETGIGRPTLALSIESKGASSALAVALLAPSFFVSPRNLGFQALRALRGVRSLARGRSPV